MQENSEVNSWNEMKEKTSASDHLSNIEILVESIETAGKKKSDQNIEKLGVFYENLEPIKKLLVLFVGNEC